MPGVSLGLQVGETLPSGAAVVLPVTSLIGSLASAVVVWLVSTVESVTALVVRTDNVILAHPIRVQIMERLSLLPGDHFRSIVRTLRIGEGDAEYHLHILVRNGLVREVKSNGRCRYYLSGAGADREKNALFARHWAFRDLRLRVLFAVRQEHGTTPASVARTLGISRQLAAYHLGRLVELGLVRRDHGHYRA